MFKVVSIEYLAKLVNRDSKIFHREIKPRIKADFLDELNLLSINNPDIGLDTNKNIFLVSTLDKTVFVQTNTNIELYKLE